MPQATPPTFGRYRVIQPLGAGGMAEVYQAIDPTLEREVAIKVVSQTGLSRSGTIGMRLSVSRGDRACDPVSMILSPC